jgi:uncharacterized circularly permuted ATP-grasp superfamily protein/uncharacterized alpha-E superfamily protein
MTDPGACAGAEPRPSGCDEAALASGRAAKVYAQLFQSLCDESASQGARTAAVAGGLMNDLGVTFSLYGEDAAHENILPFDPFPRVIDPETWEFLGRGLAQRLRLWNDFLRDTYDSQESLKNGIVPFELVYDDPTFLRPVVGLRPTDDVYGHFAAFDLARDEDGGWVVVEDYLGNTTGVTYALQARNVMTQAAPNLVDAADPTPAGRFPTELLEHLRGFSRNAFEARVVLLSPGPGYAAHYEHSYLARQMGIPLVRGSDLIVLNSRCYLKTIGGLEPIDVIYRRIDDAFTDPVSLRQDSQLGAPGLLTCVRKGTLAIVNAVGSGLGDNRAVGAFMNRFARFYAREPLLIPTVERLQCLDTDQRLEAFSSPDRYVFRHAHKRGAGLEWNLGEMGPKERDAVIALIEASPSEFVAERRMPEALLPVAGGDSAERRHAGLRCFMFGGRHPRPAALALTRYATAPGSRTISSGLGGGIKDTWVLPGAPKAATQPELILAAAPQRRLRLGSRIADSLFWMGRYVVRAEMTTRVLQALRQTQVEGLMTLEQGAWTPLWEALARATGHESGFFRASPIADSRNISHYLLLDPKNPGSVLRCAGRLRENARDNRESAPPEVWSAVNRLWRLLESAAAGPSLDDLKDAARLRELEQQILAAVDQILGAASMNMLYDDGWEFWNIGAHVERAFTTAVVTQQALLRRSEGAAAAEGPPLDAILRMLACQYAYRSLYQARPTARNVVALVLQDAAAPRSVLHCLNGIRASLERVSGPSRPGLDSSPRRTAAQLAGEVEFADLDALFAGGRYDAAGGPIFLDAWLEDLANRLLKLATEIADDHLHHQAVNILR